jgi:hypothetical protein
MNPVFWTNFQSDYGGIFTPDFGQNFIVSSWKIFQRLLQKPLRNF